MKLGTEVLHGLKWVAGAKLLSQAITWGITIYIMRLLAPSDYGLLAMATVFLGLLTMFGEIGLTQALVQRANVSRDEMRQALGVIWLSYLLLFALLNLSAPLVANFYREPRLEAMLHALSVTFLLAPMAVAPDVMLQRQLDFKRRSIIEFTTAIFTNLFTLVLALKGLGVWALVSSNIASLLWRVVALNLARPFSPIPRFSFRNMSSLLSFGGHVSGARILWFAFSQADTVIVGRILGEQVVGLYSVAMHLASLPLQRLLSILNQVAFPTLARFQHDLPSIRKEAQRVLTFASFLIFPVLWGMSSVAGEIVIVLLGPAWLQAILPLQILTLVLPFRTAVALLQPFTDAIGKPEVGLHNVILGCAVMPAAFLIGAQWGIRGVAMAWLLVYPGVLYINLQRMLAALGLNTNQVLKKIAPSIVCAGFMYLMVWLSTLATGQLSRAFALAIEILIGAAAYGLSSWIVNQPLLMEARRLIKPNQ